ncbi:hypothetical protein SS50377_27449 [Spironucleus salmonicida]|uniref:Uncharacterized protein n=1 Tax=Spironucleus salmonicida TaxID=348837 RepID=V6LHT9_9EUKA|nr:hypothetical protein SS50377_27449 [Spironucleus salmonicida]|eukprot:EST43261.1 Hypothetical protein SS50377_16925 [Spironucleus salmonicida]
MEYDFDLIGAESSPSTSDDEHISISLIQITDLSFLERRGTSLRVIEYPQDLIRQQTIIEQSAVFSIINGLCVQQRMMKCSIFRFIRYITIHGELYFIPQTQHRSSIQLAISCQHIQQQRLMIQAFIVRLRYSK